MKKLLCAVLCGLLAASPVMAASFPPLVLKSGKPQQAQSGDTVKIPNITGSTQCVHADSSGNLTGIGSDCGTGSGSVTTTGSPSSPNVTCFSGATSITNCSDQNVVYTDAVQTFTKSQRGTVQSLALSSSTATPNFDNGNNQTLTLVHASCPCTLANPSTTPTAGQSGVFEIIQSSTGSDTIGTWGSDYTAAGGTSTITLSTGANARDYISYYVADSTHIVLSLGVANATH